MEDKMECGIHNHELLKILVGHLYARRLSKEERMFVMDMTLTRVEPK